MKISVVVGTLNRRARLQSCVESVFDQTATPVRVYVTDAGSTDGTLAYLESIASERLVPIFVGKRLGQARAYNEVFARIETPYVCWLSDDNVVVNRGLDVAARILEEEPGIGMVALKVKDLTGPFVDAPYVGGVSAIGILNVNQGMLRTPVLKEAGGFSEAFGDYGIDPDLTAKVLFSGHRIAYTRRVAVHHYRAWSPDPASAEYARQMEKQRAYVELYAQKYGRLALRGAVYAAKTLAWRLLRRALGNSMNSERPFLGLVPRDWQNIFRGGYISLLDPLRCRGREYYLVQHCPRRRRPGVLPPDPVRAEAPSVTHAV